MAPAISLNYSFTTPTTRFTRGANRPQLNTTWTSLHQIRKSNSKVCCLFSDNRKQEQARISLERALGGKKTEFEKWDQEIKKREQAGGGGDGGGGGGGWFGWRRWFGGSGDDHFWHEAQQTSLTILGILFMFLIIAKGDVMLALVFNPLLFALRGIRTGLTSGTSQILQKVSPSLQARYDSVPKQEIFTRESAKERVVRKWGSD